MAGAVTIDSTRHGLAIGVPLLSLLLSSAAFADSTLPACQYTPDTTVVLRDDGATGADAALQNAGGDGGTITCSIDQSDGATIVPTNAVTNGGGGGKGGEFPFFGKTLPGGGGAGGDGGTVDLEINGDLTTTDFGAGVLAVGGFAGDGGYVTAQDDRHSEGGVGGKGGDGGNVTLTYRGTLGVSDLYSSALEAVSTGGNGGIGGGTEELSQSLGSRLLGQVGGDGGDGGNGGVATVDNYGTVNVSNGAEYAVNVRSFGGDAGDAGYSSDGEFASVSGGNKGGDGGNGGTANATNHGRISTQDNGITAILVQTSGGDGGDGGAGPGTHGGNGGKGGNGGTVNVTNLGSITTGGDFSDGIYGESNAGNGGAAASGGAGGAGGNGGNVTVTNNGTIETNGYYATAIFGLSAAGGGQDGGASKGHIAIGGSGGAGGQGGTMIVNMSGDGLAEGAYNVHTAGDFSHAVHLLTVGGGGGRGGNAEATGTFTSLAIGGSGGAGGQGGDITVNLNTQSSILTEGALSSAIVLQSVGGGGGSGGSANSQAYFSAVAIGGNGSHGGDGGKITATVGSGASVATRGHHSAGIVAQSVGGGGGQGGQAHARATAPIFATSFSMGGNGADGGDGGDIEITVDSGASVTTGTENTGTVNLVDGAGTHSIGILAQSIGGGGGNGGNAGSTSASFSAGVDFSAAVSIGGKGGSGGDAGTVKGTVDGAVTTYDAGSDAVVLQSIGGGGGNGGSATSFTVGGGVDEASLTATVAVGGSGGHGGDASTVTFDMTGSILTEGENSDGIVLQSIGGGGGNGGSAQAFTVSADTGPTITATVSVGGGGGSGGTAGGVIVNGGGQLTTGGSNSVGMLAQSIGGGGGNGGAATSITVSATEQRNLTLGATVGGKGGSGGHAGKVTVTGIGEVVTTGKNSLGIVAQSIGGGGGNAGNAASVTLSASGEGSLDANVTLGQSGGSGGDGADVTIKTNGGGVTTTGANATALLAQSLGGGGGNGGSALTIDASVVAGSGKSINAGVTIGGNGGGAGKAGVVDVTSDATISTSGASAAGIIAQSIAGSGGNAGSATTASITVTDTGKMAFNGASAVGGNGGSGGKGDTASVTNSGSIKTAGELADGILVQSIGGGGGHGGTSSDITINLSGTVNLATKNNTVSLQTTIGGKGGSGNDGGSATGTNSASITTMGNHSAGMVVQSIGGGGGSGGTARTIAGGAGKTDSAFGLEIGGEGGAGGNGGKVELTNSGDVTTWGNVSAGLVMQSVGGGGGTGGNSLLVAAYAGAKTRNTGVVIGGQGGNGGHGGYEGVEQTLTHDGTVTTHGHRSAGILAQSVGGGGGAGGDVLTRTASLSYQNKDNSAHSALSGTHVATLGSDGGTGGSGFDVLVNVTGTVDTYGHNAHGIIAQSIAGGGGTYGAIDTFDLASVTQDEGSPSQVDALSTRLVDKIFTSGAYTGVSGSGGKAEVHLKSGADVTTRGAISHGLLVQSVSLGGGDSGYVEAVTLAPGETAPLVADVGILMSTYQFTAQMGGQTTVATVAGKPAVATVDAGTVVATGGTGARGILVQSVAGGGGTHATVLDSIALAPTVDQATLTANLGQADGATANALSDDAKIVVNAPASGSTAKTAIIQTTGDLSHAIVAQSISNGGGSAGAVFSEDLQFGNQEFTTNLGARSGSTAATGTAGKASVQVDADVYTTGSGSYGVLAQSIADGGGEAFIRSAAGTNATVTVGLGAFQAHKLAAGTVDVTASGLISTTGNLAHGIVAQSISGGGGLAAIKPTSLSGTFTVDATLGGAGNLEAKAGTVTVAQKKSTILTTGDMAFGILAQSLGGGGAISLDAGDIATTVNLTLSKGNFALGGDIKITVDADSRIQTTGKGAHGIFAQSGGGGGGLLLIDAENATINPSGHSNIAVTAGNIDIVSDGTIVTQGDSAHGIYAYSVAGPSVVFQNGANLGFIGGDNSPGDLGRVTVQQSGLISVSGKNASAVYAMTSQGHGTGIDITTAGTITASGEGGTGIYADNQKLSLSVSESALDATGATTTTKIHVAEGSVVLARDAETATDAVRIRESFGRASLTIDGTVAAVGADGSKIATYGGKQNAISTDGDGTITVGKTGGVEGTIAIGTGTMNVVNNGVIDGSVQNAGLYTLNTGGRHYLELDPLAGTAAYISALVVDAKGGTIHPYLANFAPFAHELEIVDAIGPSDVPQYVKNTPVLTFHTTADDTSVSVTGVTASFAGAGLSGNAATVAEAVDPLVQSWMDGSRPPEDETKLYAFLLAAANTESTADLSKVLSDHLDTTQDYDVTVRQHTAAISHIDNLHSCGTQDGPFAALREDECNWLKAYHRIVDDFASSTRVRASGVALGRQAAIADDWRLGLGASFEITDADSPLVSSDGNALHAGAVLKYTAGPWLATGALSASYSWGDRTRALPATGDIAGADQRAAGLSARMRLAHEFEFGPVFAIPTLDLDVSWIHDFGYTETGAGSLDMKVDAHDAFFVDLHPQLRLGTDFLFENDLVLRPYVEAGVAFALEDSQTSTQSFASGPLAGVSMSVKDDREDVSATFAAGLSVLQGDRFEAKLRYEGRFGEETRSQSASLKFGLHF